MLKYLLVLGFAIAFGAGLVIGLEQRVPAQASPTTTPAPRGRGFLTSELNLTPEQQDKMKKIWQGVRPPSRELWASAKKERDEQIAALIRPEDKEKFNQIIKTYSERQEELNRQAQTAFHNAEQATKEILNPEQLSKYEQILKNHRGPDHGPGPGPGPHQRDSNRRGDDRATSRPGSDK
jgi:Spy/CpxP family protein refolding chaperone